jgi:ABC-type multidrug transport system ATPase subunit
MMARKPMSLMIEGLSAGYARRPVIRDMTLGPIQAGHVTALVGPNAAGKSTLLLALAGLIVRPGLSDSASATCCAFPSASAPRLRRSCLRPCRKASH